ncbi:MAG: NTP transferase domain-containing protein [Nanoarchaeota archaeon]|nr:NTP transferase domain-containing protein [Nanoarchaeota archaeon]
MQAVLLAAGISTRTYPLTITKPKPLLKIANKTIIEHNLDSLVGIAKEAIIVVNYMKEDIIDFIGEQYKNITIKYIDQEESKGTGHALMICEHLLKDRFMVLNSDDFFAHKDIKRCIRHKYAVLGKELDETESFGVFSVEENVLKDIEEKPKSEIGGLVNTGLYVLDKKIFDTVLKKSKRGEYEITDYLKYLIRCKEDIFCEKVEHYWHPIVYPWSLLDANSFFVGSMKKSFIKGKIEKNVTIKGKIMLGVGSSILSGVCIEGNVIIGKGCKIGPNCYLRGDTTIGDNCHIGQAVEIKNSIIGDNSNIPHLSYVGDSVIGDNVNFGAGTSTANLRHDNSNIHCFVKGDKTDTNRRKLGAIVADDVHTGINTSIYPGRMIWPGKTTLPGETVSKDIN